STSSRSASHKRSLRTSAETRYNNKTTPINAAKMSVGSMSVLFFVLQQPTHYLTHYRMVASGNGWTKRKCATARIDGKTHNGHRRTTASRSLNLRVEISPRHHSTESQSCA